jgi:hypothetical protein
MLLIRGGGTKAFSPKRECIPGRKLEHLWLLSETRSFGNKVKLLWNLAVDSKGYKLSILPTWILTFTTS